MSGVACGQCGEPCGAVDAFCEACGAQLGPVQAASVPPAPPASAVTPCTSCGASVDSSGFCSSCGLRQPSPRDHAELDLGPVGAGVSDKGRSHHRNEDAFALGRAADGTVVALVCDGVSTASRSDEAALAASDAALDAALDVLASGGDATRALERAAAAAQSAVVLMSTPADVPSCTFVGAVVHGSVVTTGCVGDSRAYLLDGSTATPLTRDDSWAAEVVAAGDMSVGSAFADPRAHHITRWIGPDSPSFVPSVSTATAPAGAHVVVCSDGLWNEVPDPIELASIVASVEPSAPLAIARRLVDEANARGGRDNISVVVVPVPAPATAHTGGSDT